MRKVLVFLFYCAEMGSEFPVWPSAATLSRRGVTACILLQESHDKRSTFVWRDFLTPQTALRREEVPHRGGRSAQCRCGIVFF